MKTLLRRSRVMFGDKKLCALCLQILPVALFSLLRRQRCGRRSRCRFCMAKGHSAKTDRGKPTEERFWARVDRSNVNGCWLWKGTRHPAGYGKFSDGGRLVPAHRMSYLLAHGECPSALLVCHRCDNPPCVRPDHLFLGTHRDNSDDMIRKGRGRYNPSRGEQASAAKLTADQVTLIRHELASGAAGLELARRFGVSKALITLIKQRRVWGHI